MSDACDKIPTTYILSAASLFFVIPISSLDTPQKSCDKERRQLRLHRMIPSDDAPLWLPFAHGVLATAHGHACATAPRGETQTMADTIRTGIVGATVTQGGSGGAPTPTSRRSTSCRTTHCRRSVRPTRTPPRPQGKVRRRHAFHDIDAMAQHPEIDLVVVCVRVPAIKTSSWPACTPNKAVSASGPGRTLAEAQEWRPAPRRAASRPWLACRRAATRR